MLIIFWLGLAIYFPALFNGFIWDDEEQIVNNFLIRLLSNWPKFFTGGTFPGLDGNLVGLYFRPLTTLITSLIYQVFNLNAWGYHLVQIIFHSFNAILVFLIINQLTRRRFPAWVAGLVFLLHTINAETVVYAANLQDTLYFFFGAGGLYLILTGRKWLGTAGLFLSVLSKETGLLFLILAGFYFPWAGLISLPYSYLRFITAKIFFEKQGLAPITLLDWPQRLIHLPAITTYYFKTIL